MPSRPSWSRRVVPVLGIATVLAACGGGSSDAPPSVDMTGVWFGNYTTSGGQTGPVILDLAQSGASLTGGVELLGSSIPDGNVGVGITGTVSGHQVSFKSNSSDDSLDGTESSGVISGTISSGVLATWSATRVETHTLSVAASQTPVVASPRLLAYQGGALWFPDSDNTLKQVGGLSVPTGAYCQEGLDACGNQLVCTLNSGKIALINPTTSNVTQITPAVRAGGVTCGANQQSLWTLTGTSVTPNIQQLDLAGATVGSPFSVPGILGGLTFDGTDLWVLESFPHILVRVSTATGDIVAAYQISEARTTYDTFAGLSWDGGGFWTLHTNYSHGDATSALKLVVSD